MSLTLYSVFGNYRARAVEVAAEFGGVEVNFSNMQWTDLHSKENKERNPLGQIPNAKLTEGYLAQTNAILRYVGQVSKNGNLYGKCCWSKAQVDDWLDCLAFNFLSQGLGPINYKIWEWAEVSEEKLKGAWEYLEKNLSCVESELGTNPYLVGDYLTIADFAWHSAFVYAFRCAFGAEFRAKWPKFTAWFERVSAEPSVAKYFGKNRYPAAPWF